MVRVRGKGKPSFSLTFRPVLPALLPHRCVEVALVLQAERLHAIAQAAGDVWQGGRGG